MARSNPRKAQRMSAEHRRTQGRKQPGQIGSVSTATKRFGAYSVGRPISRPLPETNAAYTGRRQATSGIRELMTERAGVCLF